METKQKQPDESTDRAVSPVIGVILMVAITVILAAVIAAFVLDIGSSTEANPNAGVQIDGDTITVNNLGQDTQGVYCSQGGDYDSGAFSGEFGDSVGDTFTCPSGNSIIGVTDSGNEAVIQNT